jgi:DNA-binding response OmpR family regulator/anti-sigma regulatory factor (Ser/Thr protein kinase)
MKSRFFTNLSHEFRTPLLLITGPVERLLSGHFRGNLAEQYEMIKRNARQLLELIEQLLDISRLEAGILPLHTKPRDLVSLLRGMLSLFASLAEQKNVTLAFHTTVASATVWVDHEKLEKIINNLLSNALKFTPEGGSVRVSVTADMAKPDFIEVAVMDSGIGIAPEHLSHIFDRFYQVDDSSGRAFGGSGIGLALVKELAELQGWRISVQSEPGKGTDFKLSVPIAEPQSLPETVLLDGESVTSTETGLPEITSATETAETAREANQPAPEASTILIVEDSQDVRAYLSGLLQPDYQILEIDNAEGGLKIAAEKMPDLIISDVMMPGIDGMEFCRRLKMDLRTSHIPVILLTARASGESKVEGLETGADDYITKPFDFRELSARVRNLLDQRRRLREKFARELAVEPAAVTVNPLDAEFLQRAFGLVEQHLDDPDFESEAFARGMYLSRSQLHRKLHALTGQGPGEFLRIFRLKRAAQMLLEQRVSVTQVAYAVGFESLSHFSKAFRRQFQCPPSGYLKRIRQLSRPA